MLRWKDLRSYQVVMSMYAVFKKRCGLFMGLGLGKTIVTLTAIAILDALGLSRRTLIVAPKRVAETVWHTEAKNWSHTRYLNVALALGPVDKRLAAINSNAEIVVINVENLLWLLSLYPKIADWPFDTVVLDESSLFKNNSSKRFKALRKFTRREAVKRGGGLRRIRSPIKRIYLLTATPAANGLGNLWSQICLLDDGEALGRSFDAYIRTHFQARANASRFEKPEIRKSSRKKIYKKLANLVKVLITTDYIDMPDIIYNPIELALPPKVRKQYDYLEKNFLLELDNGEDILAPNTASLRMKLQQFANGAVIVGDPEDLDYVKGKWEEVHTVKLDALEEIMEVAEGNESLIIGYWFKSDEERLRKRFPDMVFIKDHDTLEIVERWNRGEIANLAVQIAGASHGLNLQYGGATIIYFSNIWDLEVHDQFVGRVFRPGQNRGVTINYLCIANSVEQKIVGALRTKTKIQNHLLDDLNRRSKK